MTELRISSELALPLDAVTQTFGILAVRGAGKSNLAAVMAEAMFAAGLPFCVIDPVGSWWGLRSSSDGKGAGLPVLILGGRHGDAPLERTGGALIADLVVDKRLTCVLDVSELSEGDKVRFLIDFAERLYRRNTEPLHLFLEEADDYCPERFTGDKARLLGAWQNIVRRGRARGLGITMITQRSAALSKSVLTQIETLFALRTTSPQDRAAIKAWVDYQGGAQDMLATLPQLESGEAWVWSPSWLKAFRRVRVLRRATFDSGATPKNVKGARPPATLASVDLDAVRSAMAETIERAKADDPKALRARIAELERDVRAKPAAAAPVVVPKEVPAISPADRKAFERNVAELDALADKADRLGAGLVEVATAMQERAQGTRKIAADLRAALAPAPAAAPSERGERGSFELRAPRPALSAKRPPSASNGHGAALSVGQRSILTAVLQAGDSGITRKRLTIMCGYARSTRDRLLQELHAIGCTKNLGDAVYPGDAAFEAMPDYEPLPTGDELRRYWLGKLNEGQAKILSVVCDAYPKAVDRDVLSEATGYARSTRDRLIQEVAAPGLLERVGKGAVRASAELFG